MIAALRQLTARGGATAILWREAARTSRRWQTYAARVGFSGALLGAVLLGTWAMMRVGLDPADMGWMGRALFIGASTVLLAMALGLAPLLTSAALIEEREDRTLELLVLTHLTPAEIFLGKVISRILLLLTVVMGALPVLAIVVSLGGVAPHQVVTVVTHALVAVLFGGCTGALFGLYTRSPLLAMLASAATLSALTFLLPTLYVIATGRVTDAAQFSLFAGATAADWSGLVAPLTHLPALIVVTVLGARLFALQVAQAPVRQAFSAQTWSTRAALIGAAALSAAAVAVAVPSSLLVYSLRMAEASGLGAAAAELVARAALLLCFTGLHALATWALLRVGVDIVDALDAILRGDGRRRRRRATARVWRNPVAWREVRPSAWRATALPMLGGWTLAMLGFAQTGWWLIPGGAVAVGALNTAAAVGAAAWLASRSVALERRRGTLPLLLTTPLPAGAILRGKALGALGPTAPLLLVTAPFYVLGVPYAALLEADPEGFFSALVRGALLWGWTVALWVAAVAAALTIAAAVRDSRSGSAVALAVAAVALGLPTVAGRLFPDTLLIGSAARLVAPPLAGGASLLTYAASIGGWLLLAAGSLAVTGRRLRAWSAAAALVLAASLAIGPIAQAQQPAPDALRVEARPIGDLVRPGSAAAVWVRVANLGPPLDAQLRLQERDGAAWLTHQRDVPLRKGETRGVTLLYRAGSSTRPREVEVLGPGRGALAPFDVRVAGPRDVTVGVLDAGSRGLHLLRDAHGGAVPGHDTTEADEGPRRVLVSAVGLDGLPTHAIGWSPYDLLVWPDADPTAVPPEALDALLAWVDQGGHLVVTLGERHTTLRGSPLADALPLRPRGARQRTDLEGAYGQLGAAPPTTPTLVIDTTPAAPDVTRSWTPLRADDGAPLWATRTYGAGTIATLALDPWLEPFASAVDAEALWRTLLHLPAAGAPDPATDAPAGAWRQRLQGRPALLGAFEPERLAEAAEERRAWLADMPGVAPLPVAWLVLFSALYLLVIGPVDGLVLRALRRQPLTWVTFPLAVVLFSAVALAGTRWTKGSRSLARVLQHVQLHPGSERWHGELHVGLFTSQAARVAVRTEPRDSSLWPAVEAGYAEAPVVVAGLGAGAYRYGVQTWTLGYSSGWWTAPAPGEVTLHRDEAGWALHNQLPEALQDAVLFDARTATVTALGTIAPGARATLPTLSPGDAELGAREQLALATARGPGDTTHWLLATLDDAPPVRFDGVTPSTTQQITLRVPLRLAGGAP